MSLQQCGARGPPMHTLVVVCTDDEDGQRHLFPPSRPCCVYLMRPASQAGQLCRRWRVGPASRGCCNLHCFCEALFIEAVP